MADMQAAGVIAAVVAMGVVLAIMTLRLARDVDAFRRDINGRLGAADGRMDSLARDVADLRVRMARLEGLMVGFIWREGADARSR